VGCGVRRGKGGGRRGAGEGGRVLALVRDRGEHYLPRPLLLTGTSILAVELLAIYILVPIPLSVLIAIPFSFVLFGLASLLTSEISFPLPDFSALAVCVLL
jgi:hypothetical protein